MPSSPHARCSRTVHGAAKGRCTPCSTFFQRPEESGALIIRRPSQVAIPSYRCRARYVLQIRSLRYPSDCASTVARDVDADGPSRNKSKQHAARNTRRCVSATAIRAIWSSGIAPIRKRLSWHHLHRRHAFSGCLTGMKLLVAIALIVRHRGRSRRIL